MRELCRATGKTVFATKQDAQAWILKLTRPRAKHIYRCGFCQAYHTSRGRGSNAF